MNAKFTIHFVVAMALLFAPVQLEAQIQIRIDSTTTEETIDTVLAIFERETSKVIDLDQCSLAMSRHGMRKGIRECDEKASVFIGEQEISDYQKSIAGDYSGVGMTIWRYEDQIIAVPNKGSPSDMAGIKGGDIIVRVDSIEIRREFPVNYVASLIRGPTGSVVNLYVVRNGQRIGTISIVRGEIDIHSVVSAMIDSEIGYINIRRFNKDVNVHFYEAITELVMHQGAKGLVIDVRNNPGGYLDEVLAILETKFSPDSAYTMVILKLGRNVEEVKKTRNKGVFSDIPIVVITDRRSASASEILAGVLQEWGAEVVGDTTFGKGSSQISFLKSTKAGLKFFVTVTNSEFCVGDSCKKVDGVGIAPDYFVPSSEVKLNTAVIPLDEARINLLLDGQLRKAVEVLRAKIGP